MKKGFVFLSIILMLALAGFIPVKADDVSVVSPYVDTPTLSNEQIKNLQNASTLLEYLRQGGTIDIKNTSSDYSAADLLSDFGGFVEDVIGNIFEFVNPFQTEVQYHGLQPIRLATPAVYNLLGVLPFYWLNPSETTDINADPDYQSYIDIINGDSGTGYNDFYWSDWVQSYSFGNQEAPYYISFPLNTKSYKYEQSYNYTSGNGSGYINSYDLTSVYINKVPDSDSYLITINTNKFNQFLSSSYNTSPSTLLWCNRTTLNYPNPTSFRGDTSYQTIAPYTLNSSYVSLTAAFEYLCHYWRNINIYVDGSPWAIVGKEQTYNIEISTGTITSNDPNGKVRWEYDTDIFYDIQTIIDTLDDIIELIKNTPNTPTIIKWDDLKDVIVDVDGQPAIGVKVLTPDTNIDLQYLETYGPIIPVFVPLFTPVIDDSDILNIATTPMQAIPQDIIDVFAYIFIGGLFVCFIHRLLE